MTEIANPRYCPTNWLDESNPLANTPEDFARFEGDGKWLLIDPDENSEDETYFKEPLEPGQVVKFGKLTNYDDFTLVIHEDGSHTALLPEFDGYPGFRLEEWEYEDTVDELSELIRLGTSGDTFADASNPLPAGSYIVECWAWRDDLSFRFEPDGETPKFVPCAGSN